MGEIETNEDVVDDVPVATVEEDCDKKNIENTSTEITEYKEVEEPCVALTIIGENKLTDTEVFIRRGIRYSIKAFFSAVVLTIMHMFM